MKGLLKWKRGKNYTNDFFVTKTVTFHQFQSIGCDWNAAQVEKNEKNGFEKLQL